MAIHGVNAQVLLSGAGLSMTAEACTDLGSDVFQVTNAAKRVIDRSAAVTVYDNAVAVDAADYTLDRLFGKITFDSTPTGPVTITGTYLPMTAVATATAFGLSRKATNPETTPLAASGRAVTREQTMKDVSGSLQRFDEADDLFVDALLAGVPVVVQLNLNGSPHARAWALLTSSDTDGEADGFLEEGVEWEGTPDVDGRVYSLA